ncbi:MAG: YibE/F family protein [Oscillospiraceae bacterium]|nr:YibE/F family protein [Oscillospiraceae bacterium]
MSEILKGLYKKIGKQRVIYIATIVFSILFLIIGAKICESDKIGQGESECYKAEVLEIISEDESGYYLDEETYVSNKRIIFKAQVENGPNEGDEIEVIQDVDDLYAYQPRQVAVGDEILVSRQAFESTEGDEVSMDAEGQNSEEWVLVEHNRISTLMWLAFLFLLLIVFIGKKKGFSAILALIFTILAIFFIYIPSIVRGFNIYLMTIIVSTFTIFMSLIILNGWNFKTICAIIGNMIGVAVAGILALIMNSVLEITGMIEQNYVMLTFMDPPIDLRAIVWGGILIGALGAIMDVSMSIASAMKELNDTMKRKSFFRMLRSGMNIGRDAIGTMTNTLILAYIGGSLATVILLAVNKNIYYLFNMEMIMVEILSAIIGSIGILAAVPATAVVSAYVFNRFEEKDEKINPKQR